MVKLKSKLQFPERACLLPVGESNSEGGRGKHRSETRGWSRKRKWDADLAPVRRHSDAGVTQPAEVRSCQDRFGGWGWQW